MLGCFGGSCGDGVGGRHSVGRERWLDGVVGRFEALKHCAVFKKELFQAWVGCVRSYQEDLGVGVGISMLLLTKMLAMLNSKEEEPYFSNDDD